MSDGLKVSDGSGNENETLEMPVKLKMRMPAGDFLLGACLIDLLPIMMWGSVMLLLFG